MTTDPTPSAGPVVDASGALAEPAGFVSRMVAFVIDLIVISLAMAGTTLVLDSLGIVFTRIPTEDVDRVGYLAIGFLAFVIYCTVGFTLFGQTLGKLLLGLRVVRADGSNPRLARSLVRSLAYSLSAILGIGFLMVLITRDRRGLHDYLAGTFVVYGWPAKPRTLVQLKSLEPLVPDTQKRRPVR